VDKKRTERTMQKIKEAKFTNAADFQMVQQLYLEYAGFIHSALKNSGEGVDGIYEGERNEANLFDGHGKMTYSDGDVYEGEWKDGKKQGFGELRTGSGNHYKGYFEEGLRCGEGMQTWPNGGSLYKGTWRAGDPHGRGRMIHQNKMTFTGMYEGEYRNGKREGSGYWQFSNGDTYDGRWSSGRIDGVGLYRAVDGYSISACWQRVEHRDARKRHNAPDGHGIKWMDPDETGAKTILYWDGERPDLDWTPITMEQAKHIVEEHRLPLPLEQCAKPFTGLTEEHFQYFGDMPEARSCIEKLRLSRGSSRRLIPP